MTAPSETTADAWKRRAAVEASVDFAMMYATHDAFLRDLALLADAARTGRIETPAATTTWTNFTRQLHVHHTTEDTGLWPRVRAAVTDPRDVAILDAMEAEHATLDPLIAGVEEALRARRPAVCGSRLDELAAGLAAHTRHEEDDALPLVERSVGAAGWKAYIDGIRKVQGIRGAAGYLPWVLDRASERARGAVLGLLPPPVRVLSRRVWEPRYRRAERL